MKQYDAIIIGFGKGGKTLAAELAKRNEKVAVIERSDEMYGGTCINIGCIPTKTLVHQAKLAPVKASWEEKKAYYAQAIAEKEEVTSFLRQKNYHNLADNPHITVYTGIGSFVSTDVVEVVMHDEILQLQAPRIYINTGAETIIPPIDGVKVNERGAIIVDGHLRTTNPNIRAIGDVKGGLQFTYISLDDYRIIREDLFGNGGRNLNDREPVSYSVFIDPPLSRIGLSEEEAVRKGLNIKVNKLPVAAIPRARTLGNTVGLFKVVVDVDTDQIVGCTLFGPESGEVINSVAMAMKTDQPYTFLRDFVFTHPSMSEALNDLMNF